MFALFRRHSRKISVFLTLNMLVSLLPPPASALTSGPSQPETQQFASAGMDNMVDPFTGDFSYNIPLMDVGGYPININYAAGITPDQEASWVGLGWNLNVGAVNRNVRGLPDDFAGDKVEKTYNTKPNQTIGVSGNVSFEIFGGKIPNKGKASLGLSTNLFYNTYNGYGMSVGVSPSVSSGNNNKDGMTGSLGIAASLGSESGLEVTPTAGLKYKEQKGEDEMKLGASISLPYSSREGLKGLSLSGSYSVTTSTNKEKELPNSRSRSVFQGFAAPTYTPSISQDLFNISISTDIGFSFTDPATEKPGFGFGGYYSGQFLQNPYKVAPAYGYMYSGLSRSDQKLLDFNREKDGGFNKFTTNLPVTNFTYDIFSVSGQGVNGSYRLYRGDVGAVHDPMATDQGISPQVGVEIGFGPTPSVKAGVNVNFNYTQGYAGKWPGNNSSINHFKPENNTGQNEMVYFRKIGEMSPETEEDFLTDVQGGTKTITNGILKNYKLLGNDGNLDGTYVINDGAKRKGIFPGSAWEKIDIPKDNFRTKRRLRTTSFTALKASEAAGVGASPIYNYPLNSFTWVNKGTPSTSGYTHSEPISRVNGNKKAHHISEIRVTDNGGSRYVYGIPAYNNFQDEVTFAKMRTDGSTLSSGIIKYSESDDSENNKNGSDHFYNKVHTGPHAHSYLLTSVLSPDYVDSDGVPGPSDGDLGNYTRFNYSMATDDFKWRTPFSKEGNEASFTDGFIGTQDDDKANYVYGSKEIWYMHSIETRTHVAEFHVKPRKDGYGAVDKNGRIGIDKPLYCLDKIVLYSKADKLNGKGQPVKTVHFEYDYILSPETPNSNALSPKDNSYGTYKSGKLTLTKIWFTYGNSGKGVLNPYTFKYCERPVNGVWKYDQNLNPAYSLQNYDRWGNYKKENRNGMSNPEFPYAEQDQNLANQYAAVYSLTSINTPTGGTMRVYYESDDYAYVQNRRAMRMFKVNAAGLDGGTNLFDEEYLEIDLDEGFVVDGSLSSSEKNDLFRKAYLEDIDLMYYKFKLEVIKLPSSREEYVPGYAEINYNECKLGSAESNTSEGKNIYKKAYIKLKKVKRTGKDVNPIVWNGWMYDRLNLNREINGSGNSMDGEFEQVLRALLAQATAVPKMLRGFPGFMRDAGNCNAFDPDHSFVRLCEPDKIKKGGGHRVKAIAMVDNWDLMVGQNETGSPKETSYYGQVYDYSYIENGKKISAGVSAYEPMLGGEENPFRMPVFVEEKVPLAPNKEFYLEEPFGESFFPAPTVGYRKVEVVPVKITSGSFDPYNAISNGTGKVVHEFYTAFNFPTITRRSGIDVARHKPRMILKFMKLDARDLVTAVQGYYVELNDMHGKQAAQRVYPYGDKPVAISEVEYSYKKTGDQIANRVTYVNSNLEVENDGPEMGLDVDVVQDERFHETSTLGGGVQLNLKYFQAAVVPIIVPTLFPDFNSEQTRFRSVVTTKVVNRYGILESTVAKDNGASITTRNLAYDRKTGEVILTEVENEFHDKVYSFTYPGHWAYPIMDLASQNEGMTFMGKAYAELQHGDEISYNTDGLNKLAYFNKKTGVLMDENGIDIGNDASKGKVMRSGYRNMLSSPVGTVVSLDNPIKGNTIAFSNVLNAGVTEYKDFWKVICNCGNTTANPFRKGTEGNIRPYLSRTYLTGRTQSIQNNQVAIRKDGVYTDFSAFWIPNGSYLRAANNPQWQYITQIANYNSLGMEIENEDALHRFSMAQFGYGRKLPVATSNNSKYQETGYDGFEDYDFSDCQDDHFRLSSDKKFLTDKEAHTGRKSIVIKKGESVSIEKIIVPCQGNSAQ